MKFAAVAGAQRNEGIPTRAKIRKTGPCTRPACANTGSPSLPIFVCITATRSQSPIRRDTMATNAAVSPSASIENKPAIPSSVPLSTRATCNPIQTTAPSFSVKRSRYHFSSSWMATVGSFCSDGVTADDFGDSFLANRFDRAVSAALPLRGTNPPLRDILRSCAGPVTPGGLKAPPGLDCRLVPEATGDHRPRGLENAGGGPARCVRSRMVIAPPARPRYGAPYRQASRMARASLRTGAGAFSTNRALRLAQSTDLICSTMM